MTKRKYSKPMSRSDNMSKIKSKNTLIEVLLRKELWKRGLRYRIHDNSVAGKPDICFKGLKIAVFCDSEFWHGKKFLDGEVPKKNREYWSNKFLRNIIRDKQVTEMLIADNWTVLRFWGSEIKNRTTECADVIEDYIKEKQEKNDTQ